MEESWEVLPVRQLVDVVKAPKVKEAGRPDEEESRKTASWCGSKQERADIQQRLIDWRKSLHLPRAEPRTSLSEGIWNDEQNRALLSRWGGKQLEYMGRATLHGSLELVAEEALFLLESSSLDLLWRGVPVSIQQGYSLLLGQDCSRQEYLVYAKLMLLGFKVVRHQRDLDITECEDKAGEDLPQRPHQRDRPQHQPLHPLFGENIRPVESAAAVKKRLMLKTQTESLCKSIILDLLESLIERSRGIKRAFDKNLFPADRGAAKIPRLEQFDENQKRSKNTLASPKYEVLDDDWPAGGKEEESGYCWRCLTAKHGKDSAAACPALDRRCSVCGRLGHVPAVHQVSEGEARERILASITDPETGDFYDQELLWSPPPPQSVPDVVVIDDDCDDDDEVVVCDEVNGARTSGQNTICNHSPNSIIEEQKNTEDDSQTHRVGGGAIQNGRIDQAEIFARSARILAELQSREQLRKINRVQAAAFQMNRRDLVNLDRRQTRTAAFASAQSQISASGEGGNNEHRFSCSVCDISCSSAGSLGCHLAGAKHKKRLRRLPPAERAAALRAEDSTVPDLTAATLQQGSREKFFCDICGIMMVCADNFRSHLEGKRHLKTLQAVANKQRVLELTAPRPQRSETGAVLTVVLDDENDNKHKETEQKEEECILLSDDDANVQTQEACSTRLSVSPSSGYLPAGRDGDNVNPEVESFQFQVGPAAVPAPSISSPASAQQPPRLPSRARILRGLPNAIERAELVLEVRPELLPEMSRPGQAVYHLTISALRTAAEIEADYEELEAVVGEISTNVDKLGGPASITEVDEIVVLSEEEDEEENEGPLVTGNSDTPPDRPYRGFWPAKQFSAPPAEEIDFGHVQPCPSSSPNNGRRLASSSTPSTVRERRRNSGMSQAEMRRWQSGVQDALLDPSANSSDMLDSDANQCLGIIPQLDGRESRGSESSSSVVFLSSDESDSTSSSSSSRSSSESSSDSHDDVSAHDELRYLKVGPLASLWCYEGFVGPLIAPEMADSMAAVMARTQMSPAPRKSFPRSRSEPLTVSFDCYREARYRKSVATVPDYRIVIVDFHHHLPNASQLSELDNRFLVQAPVLFAVVNCGTVSFFSADRISLPDMIESG